MFPTEDLKQLIEQALPGATVSVTGDGYQYQATVVSERFQGLSTMKQHQMVYAAVNHLIASGEVHALSLKTAAG